MIAGGTTKVSDGTNQLQINPDGSLTVRVSDGTDTLAVNSDGSINVNVLSDPSNPVLEALTATVAAGATVNLDTATVGAGTKKLRQVVVSSSVPIKARIGIFDGMTFTSKIVMFVPANNYGIWNTPHPNYLTYNFDGTNDVWRVEITNMDNNPLNVADVYATVLYES